MGLLFFCLLLPSSHSPLLQAVDGESIVLGGELLSVEVGDYLGCCIFIIVIIVVNVNIGGN